MYCRDTVHRESISLSLSLSLSLSIIFTSGAVRQGKDTIMRGEAENRLTLAFYRITCWENSDFWAPLSSYLFIHFYIYLFYLFLYLSIYLFFSFPLEQSFDRQGWSEMLVGEGACGKFHDIHAGKFRSEPEGKTDGGMEGQDSHSPSGPCAQTFILRTHSEYGSERFVQERLLNTCVCHCYITSLYSTSCQST